MISSAIPSVKYSFSGSALMLTNGSTAIDLAAAAPVPWVGDPGGVVTPGAFRAWANTAAVACRSAGSLASAFNTACSTQAGASARKPRNGGGGDVKHCAMIACAVLPMNGVRPVSISYTAQAI